MVGRRVIGVPLGAVVYAEASRQVKVVSSPTRDTLSVLAEGRAERTVLDCLGGVGCLELSVDQGERTEVSHDEVAGLRVGGVHYWKAILEGVDELLAIRASDTTAGNRVVERSC